MPRIREEVETAPEDAVKVESTANGEKPKRSRRPAPDGVTLGALTAPVPVELPANAVSPRAGGRGRSVDERTLTIIRTVSATPGQWFHVGTYMSPQSPNKDQLLGQQGFEFRSIRNDQGAFDRYAMLPVADETQEV